MPDLREIPPGRPPWAPAPDPWWLWAVRAALAAAAAVLVAGTVYGLAAAAVGLVR